MSKINMEVKLPDDCEVCEGSGWVYPECTCYEVIGGGHQMGCCFYGLTRNEIQDLSSKEFHCPECNSKEIRIAAPPAE